MKSSILIGIYFIDPGDKEFKETNKNAGKIGKSNGSRHALQDKQERKAWDDLWQIQQDQIKICVNLGS